MFVNGILDTQTDCCILCETVIVLVSHFVELAESMNFVGQAWIVHDLFATRRVRC